MAVKQSIIEKSTGLHDDSTFTLTRFSNDFTETLFFGTLWRSRYLVGRLRAIGNTNASRSTGRFGG